MKRAPHLAAALLLLAACASPPPPPPPIPPLEPVPVSPAPAAPTEVWTRQAGTLLRGPTPTRLPYLGMRLAVLRDEGDSLQVRCLGCPGAPVGWTDRARVIWVAYSPTEARGGDLAEFVLAVREAARRRDVNALRPVMARTFVHALEGPEGVLASINALSGARAGDLARLPSLLDRGVVAVPDTRVWAAPPEFTTLRGYNDLRAGFTRGEDGWEWAFLLRAGP